MDKLTEFTPPGRQRGEVGGRSFQYYYIIPGTLRTYHGLRPHQGSKIKVNHTWKDTLQAVPFLPKTKGVPGLVYLFGERAKPYDL